MVKFNFKNDSHTVNSLQPLKRMRCIICKIVKKSKLRNMCDFTCFQRAYTFSRKIHKNIQWASRKFNPKPQERLFTFHLLSVLNGILMIVLYIIYLEIS